MSDFGSTVLTNSFIDYLQQYDLAKEELSCCREKYFGFNDSFNLEDVPECDRDRVYEERQSEFRRLRKQVQELEYKYEFICSSLAGFVSRERDSIIKIISSDGAVL